MEFGNMGMTAHTATNGLALEAVLRDSVDGVFVLDRDHRFLSFSAGCERITGYASSEVIGRHCHEAIECRDQDGQSMSGALCPSTPVMSGEVSSAGQRMMIRAKDGRQIDVEATYLPLYDGQGQIACVVSVLREASNLVGRRDELPDSGTHATDDRVETSSMESDNNALDSILQGVEKREILAALRRAHGQRSRAARALGISRSRLYRRMEALGIDPRVDV